MVEFQHGLLAWGYVSGNVASGKWNMQFLLKYFLPK